MSDTTFEEAKRCPRCTEPGREGRVIPMPRSVSLPRGTRVYEIFCDNNRCEWFNTPWMVQVNPDGTVPPKTDHTGHKKTYVGFEGHDQAARDIMVAVRENLEREAKQATQEGGFELPKRGGGGI